MPVTDHAHARERPPQPAALGWRHGRARGLRALAAAAALALAVWVAAAPVLAAARVLPVQVTRVVDGDTLWFQPDEPGAPLVAVRLRGIDAPETCQAWGRQAMAALREHVQGPGRGQVPGQPQPVSLRIHGQDDYRRTLGTLSVGGVDVNAALVAQGHAWAWRDAHGRSPYLQQEAAARSSLRGVHTDVAAETPWDFRQRHGRCRK